MSLRQNAVATAGQEINHKQTLLAIPLAGVCLLLATLSGWNALRLYYWSRKQMSTAARLQTAVREIHHRVNNNLQILSAMVDLSSQNGEHSANGKTACRIGQHL